MLQLHDKTRLPLSYYVNNGNLAEKTMKLIRRRDGEVAEATIAVVKALALQHEQECMGEPTFARAIVELIDRTKATADDKLALIEQTAKMTLLLRNLLTGQLR